MGPRYSGSLSAVDSWIYGSDFIKTKMYRRSNLSRWSRCGWLRWGWRGGSVASGHSPESGVAHAMGHRFRWGLTLRTQRSKGNSPRGSSSSGGDRCRARDGGWLAPTFGIFDDELQRSGGNEIRLCRGGTTRRRATWRWFGAVSPPTEQRRARVVARVSRFADQDSS
jgi:hypothetical protein